MFNKQDYENKLFTMDEYHEISKKIQNKELDAEIKTIYFIKVNGENMIQLVFKD